MMMYLICCLPPCMYIYLFAALFQFLFQTVFFIFSSIQGHGPDTQRREIDIKDSIETIDLSLHLNNVHVLFYCSYCSFHPTPALPPVADPSSIFHLPASRSYTISNLALDQKQMCWWIILLAIIAPTLSHKSPIVIIPGLGGSTLEAKLQNRPAQRDCTTESEYYTIWASIVQGTTRYACFRNNIQLYLNQSTPSGLSNFTGVQIRPRDFGGTGGIEYSNAGTIDEPKIAYMHALVKSLVARGYKRSISIRAATNDFRSVGLRATNEYEYARLKWLIEDTQNLNNGSKVHLLSHSQGGPLTNLFLTTYVSSSWKAQYIASHIMLSAPLLGSSVSIYAAISGPSYDWIPQFLPNMVVPLIRTFVSILWMWPKVGKQDVWGNETVFVQTPLKNYTLKNLDELTHDIPNASILFDKWDEVQNATAHSFAFSRTTRRQNYRYQLHQILRPKEKLSRTPGGTAQ
jgi:hypothetical protein